MDIDTKKEVDQIKDLLSKSSKEVNSQEALNYAQAALNSANALAVIKHVLNPNL